MRKPNLLRKYELSKFSKKKMAGNPTSQNNFQFSVACLRRYWAGEEIKAMANELGVDSMSLRNVLSNFMALTKLGGKFGTNIGPFRKVFKDPLKVDLIKQEIDEVNLYLKALKTPGEKPVTEKWTPGKAALVQNVNRVRHILGGGDKDRTAIEELVMIKDFAAGEEPGDIAARYEISPDTVRGRMESRFKRTFKHDFDRSFIRENKHEVRIMADNAIYDILGHVKVEALANIQAELDDTKLSLEETIQAKAMFEVDNAEAHAQLNRVENTLAERERTLSTVSAEKQSLNVAYEQLNSKYHNATLELSQVKRLLKSKMAEQERTETKIASPMNMPKPAGMFSRILRAMNRA